MNGSPAKMGTISGTAGHSSALKMKAEADAASALKQTIDGVNQKTSLGGKIRSLPSLFPGGETYAEAKKEEREKGNVSKATKVANEKVAWSRETANKKTTKAKKGTYVKKGGKATGSMKDYALNTQARADEYDARGWAHDDTTKVASATKPEKLTKQQEVEAKGDIKKDNIAKKAAKRTGEVVENVSKKTAKISKKEARKKYGRGSKEHLAAKQAHLEAKVIDIQGGKGGRKRGLFRGLATKINLKRQKKNQAKIDAAKEAE